MIALRLPAPDSLDRLVDALMVAGGAVPVPDDPEDRQSYLALAHALDAAAAARTRTEKEATR
ncbi:hypothetical protein ACLQ2P_41680 [Actinomadura citrea]|uniref:hypothetical protein n=1 Tax=Actinomadura citrea TaxID=46158 RepID=UPI003CE4EE17